MVGALAWSLKQLVLLREEIFYWVPPRLYLMWQLLHIVRELACKKYSLWLELSASNTDINWESLMAKKNGEIQSEEVLDGFDNLCPFRHEKDFLVCQDQYGAELCATGLTVVH